MHAFIFSDKIHRQFFTERNARDNGIYDLNIYLLKVILTNKFRISN